MMVTIELDVEQKCTIVENAMEEMIEDMEDALTRIALGERLAIFSHDTDTDIKKIKKMLKAAHRIKSWYTP